MSSCENNKTQFDWPHCHRHAFKVQFYKLFQRWRHIISFKNFFFFSKKTGRHLPIRRSRISIDDYQFAQIPSRMNT